MTLFDLARDIGALAGAAALTLQVGGLVLRRRADRVRKVEALRTAITAWRALPDSARADARVEWPMVQQEREDAELESPAYFILDDLEAALSDLRPRPGQATASGASGPSGTTAPALDHRPDVAALQAAAARILDGQDD